MKIGDLKEKVEEEVDEIQLQGQTNLIMIDTNAKSLDPADQDLATGQDLPHPTRTTGTNTENSTYSGNPQDILTS